MLETQIAQLAETKATTNTSMVAPITSSSDTKPIYRVELRSGKGYEGPSMEDEIPQTSSPIINESQEKEEELIRASEVPKKDKEVIPPMRQYEPLPPYPHRIVERKLNDKFTQFVNLMKVLHINVPFLEAMSQMPTYAKFLKEVLTNKRKVPDEVIHLPYQVSAYVDKKLPQKQKDPGSFSLPVKIGDLEPLGALADLGASVSLMPLSIARKLNFELFPTRKIIQLADRTSRCPSGELEDVPIQVGHVFVPCDFVVMDMEEDPITPLILGREALKTMGAVINCKSNTITLEVANEKVTFELSHSLKNPMVEKICRVEVIDDQIESLGRVALQPRDKLLEAIREPGDELLSKGAKRQQARLEEAPTCLPHEDVFEVLDEKGKEESSTPPPKVDLKPLPPSLKHAYLDEACLKPVIVSAELDDQSLEKLLTVLRKFQSVIGYSIDDIKGISPSLVMHRISLDDEDASSIES